MALCSDQSATEQPTRGLVRYLYLVQLPFEVVQSLLQRRALRLGLREQDGLVGEAIAKLAFELRGGLPSSVVQRVETATPEGSHDRSARKRSFSLHGPRTATGALLPPTSPDETDPGLPAQVDDTAPVVAMEACVRLPEAPLCHRARTCFGNPQAPFFR